MKKIYSIISLSLMLLGLNSNVKADETPVTIASWDFTTSEAGVVNTTNYGPNELAPTVSDANVTVGALTRSEVLETAVGSNTLSFNIWGARNFNTTNTNNTAVLPVDDYDARIAESLSEGKYITFTVSPKIGHKLTITGIDDYKVRCNNQAIRMRWQYSIDGTTFKTLDLREDNATVVDYSISTTSSGVSIAGITFATAENSTMTPEELAELEDITQTITFRIIFYQPKAVTKEAVAGFFNSTLSIKGIITAETFPLTLASANEEQGSVDSDYTGDITAIPYGTEVDITAVAKSGYTFSQWSDGNIENPRTIVITEETSLTASFDITTGIGNATTDKGIVVSEMYYNLTGKQVSADSRGLVLKKITYEDGSTETVKQILD